MQFLRKRIKHVIYVVKENRTFDQILGDLTNGANGDPALTQFGQALTPNNHSLATEFVTLDNFMNPGDGSMDGWSWAMQGRVTNTETITQQINYAAVNRGLSYESEGTNRNVPVNFATVAERDAAAGVGRDHQLQHRLGEPARRHREPAGRHRQPRVRRRAVRHPGRLHLQRRAAGRRHRAQLRLPGEQHRQHRHEGRAGVRSVRRRHRSGRAARSGAGAADRRLLPRLRPELSGPVALQRVEARVRSVRRQRQPARACRWFASATTTWAVSARALGGVNTPETQQADCDLALGRLVEAVANSRYAADTLIIVTEDDVQDGPDHVDSHRGTAFVVGPYVKQGAVVSTRYSQVNALRTIEDILGTEHINLNTAFQRPMADVFDIRSSGAWTYAAEASTVLATHDAGARREQGSGVKFAAGPIIKPQAQRRVLGQGHRRLRLLRSRPGASCAVQQGAVGGPDGRQAVSGAALAGCGQELARVKNRF